MIQKMFRTITKSLALRDGIFYFRMDVKTSGNKYKSIKRSLRTNDFQTAIQRLNPMKHFIRAFSELTPQEQAEFIRFYTHGDNKLADEEKQALENGDTASIIGTALDVWLAKKTDGGELMDRFVKKSVELDLADVGYPDSAYERLVAKRAAMRDVIDTRYLMALRKQMNPSEEQEFEETLEMVKGSKLRDGSWEEYQARQSGKIAPRTTFIPMTQPMYQEPPQPHAQHKIAEIAKFMFEMVQIKPETQKSQESDLKNMLASQNLSFDDDYAKLNNPDVISEICEWIKGRKSKSDTEISNKRKNKQLSVLRALITAANKKEPTVYKLTELTNRILPLRRKMKGQTKEYQPFSDAQLSEMFDPKHEFFKENPEQFLACLISLFSGARTNAAITLQFGDITQESDIDVLAFFENHDRKHLKNDATERNLPIAQQLIDWGFVDMIRERQKKIGAKDTDFIFSRTQHELSGDPAKKFMTPFFKNFVRKQLGIVSSGRKIYAFHSFRDTVSNKMADCGIDNTMAKKLVGWKSGDIRYTNYSKRTIQEQKAAIDKLVYPEDVLHLEEWKKIIPDLYINQPDKNKKRRSSK